ncbi:MAG: protein adenylyltransferase SelO family protein [Pseudomonadota bacterium]
MHTPPFSAGAFRALGEEFASATVVASLVNPQIERINRALVETLRLSSAELPEDDFKRIFSGNDRDANTNAFAQAYAGHQFGNFNPFLGDGRTATIGDIQFDNQTMEVQFKGSGKTPYGFRSDGRLGVEEGGHEFDLCEKLSALNVPVSKCLCLLSGDDQVYRSGFQRSAVLTRLAPTHVRFGTFELCFFRRNTADLKTLADFVIARCFPELDAEPDDDNRYYLFLDKVITRTAELIAAWMSSDFVHGMMNTDNMSIVGITLDLSESRFLSDDRERSSRIELRMRERYQYDNQPTIGLWNCNVLARALSPIIPEHRIRDALSRYEATYLKAAG